MKLQFPFNGYLRMRIQDLLELSLFRASCNSRKNIPHEAELTFNRLMNLLDSATESEIPADPYFAEDLPICNRPHVDDPEAVKRLRIQCFSLQESEKDMIRSQFKRIYAIKALREKGIKINGSTYFPGLKESYDIVNSVCDAIL